MDKGELIFPFHFPCFSEVNRYYTGGCRVIIYSYIHVFVKKSKKCFSFATCMYVTMENVFHVCM